MLESYIFAGFIIFPLNKITVSSYLLQHVRCSVTRQALQHITPSVETTENYTLQIQVLFVDHVPESPRVPSPTSMRPTSPTSTSPSLRVLRLRVPVLPLRLPLLLLRIPVLRLRVPVLRLRVPVPRPRPTSPSHVPVPRPRPTSPSHVPVPLLVTAVHSKRILAVSPKIWQRGSSIKHTESTPKDLRGFPKRFPKKYPKQFLKRFPMHFPLENIVAISLLPTARSSLRWKCCKTAVQGSTRSSTRFKTSVKTKITKRPSRN